MAEPLTVTLCWACNHKDELDPDQKVEHLAQLFADTASLQGLQMVHGATLGTRRYVELGGQVHLTQEEWYERSMLPATPLLVEVGDRG